MMYLESLGVCRRCAIGYRPFFTAYFNSVCIPYGFEDSEAYVMKNDSEDLVIIGQKPYYAQNALIYRRSSFGRPSIFRRPTIIRRSPFGGPTIIHRSPYGRRTIIRRGGYGYSSYSYGYFPWWGYVIIVVVLVAIGGGCSCRNRNRRRG